VGYIINGKQLQQSLNLAARGAASTPLVGQKLHEQGVIICSMGVQPPGPFPVNLHSVYTTTVHVLPTTTTVYNDRLTAFDPGQPG